MELDGVDITIDCNFFDFTQLYDPKNPVLADVIAITGLDGHAYGSWRGKGELSRMWLRDFLSKDLPQCRVLTYGYNSKLTGKSRGLERILDYGRSFLEEIKQVRSTEESLVKAVLSADRASKLVYDTTYAILFFGTPHRGLSVDDIRGLLPDHEHPRHGLLDQIKSNSDALVDQLSDFKNIIQDRKIVSFYEAEQTPQLTHDSTAGRWQRTGSFATAVGTDSALLNLPDHMEEKIPLPSDHSMMVKFDSRDSKGYQVAISRLRRFEKDAGAAVSARLGSNASPGHQAYAGMTETPDTSLASVDTEKDLKALNCCERWLDASFTPRDLDSLSSTAYELFASLKGKSSSTQSGLSAVEQPLYNFKCALTHLAGNVSLVLSGPEPEGNLHAMVTVFSGTLRKLHKLVEHASREFGIGTIQTDLENHSAAVQKVLDTALA
ncbi:hypothetical protein SLS58_009239 [Diplodia intermedia]|uniref:Uncharacterized protein n=1 Tax=Diplodia intermedia TaxID=856260 RepID=A0ABR3TE08_9PEZI